MTVTGLPHMAQIHAPSFAVILPCVKQVINVQVQPCARASGEPGGMEVMWGLVMFYVLNVMGIVIFDTWNLMVMDIIFRDCFYHNSPFL